MKSMGQTSAIARIYRDYNGMIRRYLQVNLRSREDAEDLLQETFVRFQKHQAAADIDKPKNFLFTIARNLMIDRKRHQKVSEVDPAQEIDELMDPLSSVERLAAAEEHFGVLCDAVASLPPQCRRVFILRKFYQLSHKEIADQLAISVSTVEKHLALGLARCKAYLDEKQ
ncbi:sigma-70 family RNA polymerase sigma factor [Exilibacterium tricleocarpae]|uniref:Sigma-70 family RNA polymerase sigma factor n=1 Tax=Exilibacterium tricleocarpae TaxID=2591008 RepID=A0A545TFS9_9GAMM|nr:sigma-70 family RNA polymerase sigma factor [Exilibacterium tricleocarpae]TQV76036.1 sigma-70 family RNA polymerase sigma factor [Exilibacterium tricleocarpae]